MIKYKITNGIYFGISYILTMIIVNKSSLQIFSYGNNLLDGVIAILTFLGMRSFCIGLVKFFYWYNGKDNANKSQS